MYCVLWDMHILNDKLQLKSKYIVYEYRPETRKFIQQTIELLNRWIRLSWYYT